MLTNKYAKKYPGDYLSRRLIESEVLTFINNEFVTKDNMKALEARISRKMNPTKGMMARNKRQIEE